MKPYFEHLVAQSHHRSREATLGVLGLRDGGLRQHLLDAMNEQTGQDGCFLAPPVFEHTFGWRSGQSTLADLGGTLLSERVIHALTTAKNKEYRFSPALVPYQHQIESWQTLLHPEPRSVVVTTGTGSGKTECFMVPILEDLVREKVRSGKPLRGVRALFLYPLNALINSQKERLHAWTEQFGSDIRFCLYNGMTPEKAGDVAKEQATRPNEVLSRQRLREEPPPILMTNATMLEYMLVRGVDAPILQISKEEKSLRWIVLDEAHTYMGSQAAELSMLLRRVIEAFGVEASQVRFVATSATISGPGTAGKLRNYLSSLAGISPDQVVIIGGERTVPSITTVACTDNSSLSSIMEIESEQEVSQKRFDALCHSETATKLRVRLTAAGVPTHLDELVDLVFSNLDSSTATGRQREVLRWLDLMSGTKSVDGELPFVRLRTHIFQRMLHGLWSCLNTACPDKSEALTQWAFGQVFVTQRSTCTCGDPVFEVGLCHECQAPHLLAEDVNSHLRQQGTDISDPFSLLDEEIEDDADGEDTGLFNASEISMKIILAPKNVDGYYSETIDLDTNKLGELDASRFLTVHHARSHEACCAICENRGRQPASFLRTAYLGAPFYVANAVPTVLELCPDANPEDTGGKVPIELPARGRRLITFTDSRQGTARMAIKMQQEAERSRLRGLTFGKLQQNQQATTLNALDDSDVSQHEQLAAIKALEIAGQTKMADVIREQLEKVQGNASRRFGSEVTWDEMVDSLANTRDISGSIMQYNKKVNAQLFDGENFEAKAMARLLLAREFSRRPKKQNSSESLGLIRVGYIGLEKVRETPRWWTETIPTSNDGKGARALDLDDWRDFLKVAMDFHVRENTFVRLDYVQRQWMGNRFASKALIPPGSVNNTNERVQRWPLASTNSRIRLVRILAQGSGLDIKNAESRDKIDEWLRSAWQELCLRGILSGEEDRALTLSTLTFSLPTRAWVCPVTRRLIDTTFRAITPYLPRNSGYSQILCEDIELPDYTTLRDPSGMSELLKDVRERVMNDNRVQTLREEGLWSDVSDRTMEGGFYYRTAEHSAQQSAKRLEEYESYFKQGSVNVLNCSTTMEMGVDIGGITAVVMNNVPPHPANYLQRAGRAGRRNESRAIAYTLCRNKPHDQRAFSEPLWPFITAIASPNITLESERLVQRHVNSFLLSCFMQNEIKRGNDSLKLTVKWFFGGEPSAAETFQYWALSSERELLEPLQRIVKGTALADYGFEAVVSPSCEKIEQICARWRDEFERITALYESLPDAQDKYRKAIEIELYRHENEYLLRDLSVRGFLPAYGFPTDVVNLKTYNAEDFRNEKAAKNQKASKLTREENNFRYKEQPSRDMAIALREYAPGAQVVIDGRVYRSAGISLHWKTMGTKKEAQRFDTAWRCGQCGTTGFTENAFSSDKLTCSGCLRSLGLSECKTVLRPSGFLTDFFEPTTNDVSSQTFVPMARPVVSVEGMQVSLPDDRCGLVQYGTEGHIFYCSSGEHLCGYAVCLKCGRAESMLADNQLPSVLAAGTEHRAVGGMAGGSHVSNCSAENVKGSVHLGHTSHTDVLEVLLRNPMTGQWLGAEGGGEVIATTIALALRETIAERLGIDSTEMGFTYRVEKVSDTDQIRYVPQVYDVAAGGAGFATAKVDDVVNLLRDSVARLDCPANCDEVCPVCLASGDGRVEEQTLDRKAAKNWFDSSNFFDFLSLPSPFQAYPDASWWAYGANRFVHEYIRTSGNSLCVLLNSDECLEWGFGSTGFRNRIMQWKLSAEVNVSLAFPSSIELEAEQIEELRSLSKFGIKLVTYDMKSDQDSARPRFQFTNSNDECKILLSYCSSGPSDEGNWLESSEYEVLAVTSGNSSIPVIELELPAESNTIPSNANVMEIVGELNGPISEIPSRFRQLLYELAPALAVALKSDPVVSLRYSDRYICTPWNVVVLSAIMEAFDRENLTKIEIVTCLKRSNFSSKKRAPRLATHNWDNEDDLRNALQQWVGEVLGVEPTVQFEAHHNDFQHGRSLELQLESGARFAIMFDQGMGYWVPAVDPRTLSFDFTEGPLGQERSLNSIRSSMKVTNAGKWASPVTFYARD